ncbi:MAG: S-layer homology domain-containing protein [Clostridiales bacterium]|nr:S-layer homology domain-containing protein [Clostridiales bacterium]
MRFSDVGGHWAESDIYDMVARGIVDGMGNGTFAPDREITRAELVKLLAVISGGDIGGEASFVDVPADEWYSGYIAWAEASKVVNGYDNFMFMPNQTVTRQEMAVMIVRYLDYKGIQMPETGANYEFADGDEISDWALEAIGTAQRTGLLEGVEVEQNMRFIYPKNSTTRAEATTVLLRLIKRVD